MSIPDLNYFATTGLDILNRWNEATFVNNVREAVIDTPCRLSRAGS